MLKKSLEISPRGDNKFSLGPKWPPVSAPWAPLGAQWAPLGPQWSHFMLPWAPLNAQCTKNILKKPYKAKKATPAPLPRSDYIPLPGRSWALNGSPLNPHWRPWALHGRPCALNGHP